MTLLFALEGEINYSLLCARQRPCRLKRCINKKLLGAAKFQCADSLSFLYKLHLYHSY